MRVHALRLGFISLILCGLLPSACRTQGSAGLSEATPRAELGLNDVSVLIPLIEVKAFRDRLPTLATRKGSEGYVPEGLAQALMQAHNNELKARAKIRPFELPSPVPEFSLDPAAFRLVSLRFDPCANVRLVRDQDSDCLRQLRLVWQIFRNPAGPPGQPVDPIPGDANVHAIYQLTRAEFEDVVQTLRRMHRNARTDTTPMPLLPHPILAQEGPDGAYFKELMDLVDRYARASRLTHLAHLSALGPGNIWQMVLMAVEQGRFVAEKVAQTEAPAEGLSGTIQFFRRNGGEPNLEVNPAGTSPLVLAENPDFSLSPAEQQQRADTREARIMQNIHVIENPREHDARSIDCGSCHRAFPVWARASAAQRARGQASSEDPKLYKAPGWDLSFKTPEELLDFTGPWTLQMFSYFGRIPKITPRVINESAEVLLYLEKHY